MRYTTYHTGQIICDTSFSREVSFNEPITPSTVKLGICDVIDRNGDVQYTGQQLNLLQTSETSFSLQAGDRDLGFIIVIRRTYAEIRSFGNFVHLNIKSTIDNIDYYNQIPEYVGEILIAIFGNNLAAMNSDPNINFIGDYSSFFIKDSSGYIINAVNKSVTAPYNDFWNCYANLNILPDYDIDLYQEEIGRSNYKFSVEPIFDDNGVCTKIKFIFDYIFFSKQIHIRKYFNNEPYGPDNIIFGIYPDTLEYEINNHYNAEPITYFKDTVIPDSAPESNSIIINKVILQAKIFLNKENGTLSTSIFNNNKDVSSYRYVTHFILQPEHISNNTGIFKINNSGEYSVICDIYDSTNIDIENTPSMYINATLDDTEIYLKINNLHELNIGEVEYADEYEIELNGEVIKKVKESKI